MTKLLLKTLSVISVISFFSLVAAYLSSHNDLDAVTGSLIVLNAVILSVAAYRSI